MGRMPVAVKEGYSSWSCPVAGCSLTVLTLNGEPTDHTCPYYAGTVRISWMTYGPSLLQSTWEEMDALTELLLGIDWENYKPGSVVTATGYSPLFKNECAARARGIASVLARFMVPHMTTEDQVVRESVKRVKAVQAGEEYETPGLGARLYEPPPGENKYATKHTRPAPTHNLTVDQCSDIMGEYKDWPDDILASTYETTIDVIKYIKSTT